MGFYQKRGKQVRITTRYTFDEVSVKRTKRYTDEDGKKRQKTRKFSQTLNPFNKNKDGSIKTYDQIMKEITKEADAWMESDDL